MKEGGYTAFTVLCIDCHFNYTDGNNKNYEPHYDPEITV